MVHDRRPQILVLDRQHLGQGLGFGLEPLHAAFGVGQGRAGGFQRLTGGGVRRFGVDGGVFGGRGRLLNVFDGDR